MGFVRQTEEDAVEAAVREFVAALPADALISLNDQDRLSNGEATGDRSKL